MSLDCLLFSTLTPGICLALGVLAAVGAAWFSSRKRVGLRNGALALAVLAVVSAYASRYGLYLYPAGCGDETLSIAMVGDAVVVADRRTVHELMPDVETDPTNDDVLRLHVLEGATGHRRCRAVAGYQARLLDVLDGYAWVGVSGFGSAVRWSYRMIRRMSLGDCSVEDVLDRGWESAVNGLAAGVREKSYAGGGTMLLVGNDGTAVAYDLATRAQHAVAAAELAAHVEDRSNVWRPERPVQERLATRTIPNAHPDFVRVGRVNDGGSGWRNVPDQAWVSPRFLAVAAEGGLTLMAHRDGLDGPLVLTALDDDAEPVWNRGEEEVFGTTSTPDRTRLPMAASDATMVVVVYRGRVTALDWRGNILWRERV
jgi:hypothetical protein